MPVLKIKNNGVWEQVGGIPDHTHVVDDITDFPTSLPANGGNADTVDGKHASDFASAAEMTTVQNNINDINTMLDGIDIPTTLPNPKSLTFTGAVEGTYDGSNPLTVEIPTGGVQFTTDETLSLKDGVLSVRTAQQPEPDNTLPITSAAVHTTVGNIEIILQTI